MRGTTEPEPVPQRLNLGRSALGAAPGQNAGAVHARSNGEVEGPRAGAGSAPRAHTVF